MIDKLVMFDVDGTLVRTNKVDGECYLQALADEFGITGVNVYWTEYMHSTDSGVFPEIIHHHLGRPASDDDRFRFQRRFVSLLEQSFNIDPAQFTQIDGASRMLDHLERQGQWGVAVATGAFHASATFKLEKAGIDWSDLPLASADDAISREDILRLAIARASQAYRRESFNRIVSVGDAPWDVETARRMELPFIGINGDQRDPGQLHQLGAKDVFSDFTDMGSFCQALETAEVPTNETE